MSFKKRSYNKELLDCENLPFDDIRRNMQELDFINTYLGGHGITLKGVGALFVSQTSPIKIVEIGCGGGDNLRVIKKWLDRKNVESELIGVDINPECIAFAKSRAENAGIQFFCSDYKLVAFETMPHIIFCSLFCHHFDDENVTSIMGWMQRNSQLGFFINDLHRQPLAYHSIKLLTGAFSKSYMVKHDAPLSVKRGFRKKELIHFMSEAGIKKFSIKWMWAFRWLIIGSSK